MSPVKGSSQMSFLEKLQPGRWGRLALLCGIGALTMLSFGASPASAAPSCQTFSAENPTNVVQDAVGRPFWVSCWRSEEGGDLTYAVKSTTTAAGGTVSAVQTVEICCGDTAPGVKYTPKAGYTGPDSFVVTATDSTGSTDVTYYIEVVPHAPPTCRSYPMYSDAPTQVRSGRTKTLIGSCYSETDGYEGVEVKLESQPAQGSVAFTGSGSYAQFAFTAQAGQEGEFSFTYSATNAYGKSNVATITVAVTPTANELPRCWSSSPDAFRTTIVKRITMSCDDNDRDALTYRITDAPDHGTLGQVTQPTEGSYATVDYAATDGYVGPDAYSYVANDGFGDSEEVTVTLDVKAADHNTVPVCHTYQTIKVESGATAYISPSCSDAQSDPLTYKLDDPPHGTLEKAAAPFQGSEYVSFKYTPDAGYIGKDTVSFTANDGFGDSLPSVHEVEVSEAKPPSCTPPTTPLPVRPDKTKYLYVSCWASVGTYPTQTVTQQPEHGTLTQDGGGFRYTPDAGYTGPDSFKFTSANSVGTSPEYTFPLNVSTDANELPGCNTQATGHPYGGVHMRANTSRVMYLSCYDVDDDPLTRTIVDQPDHGTLVLVGEPGSSEYKYTPDPDFVGTDSYAFKANDGRADSSVATQTLTIHEADWNNVPVCTQYQPITTEGNQTIWMYPYCSDEQGDRLTYEIVDAPAHGTAKVVTENEGSSWSWTSIRYTPETDYEGTDSFSFVADDGRGESAKMTIQLTLTKPQPPRCEAPGQISWRSGLVRFLHASCYGGPGGGPVTFKITDQPDHGTLETNAWGGFLYKADAAYEGADSFSYVASNAAGESPVQTQSIALSKDYNTQPHCGNFGYPPTPHAVRTGTQKALHLFCFDAENDKLTYSVVDGPAHGSLSPITVSNETGWEPGLVTYTPAEGYLGSDSFTVRANDGRADSAGVNTVSLKVIAADANTAPTCMGGSGWTFMLAQNLTFELSESNTMVFCGDAEGDELTSSVVEGPQHGTLSDPVDGVRTYTPAAGYLGPDTIKMKVSDGRADAPGTLTITFQITEPVDVVPQPVEAPDGGTVNVGAYTGTDGLAVITVPSGEAAAFPDGCMPLSIKTAIDPAGGQISDPVLVLEPTDASPARIETPLTGGDPGANSEWTGSITCVESGKMFVEYLLTEGDEQLPVRVPIGGLVLIDPQGVVYDKAEFDAAKAAGKSDEDAREEAAIEGATAVLQRRVNGQWKKVLAGDPGIKPNINPQVTGTNGLFQWDVSEGTYRVVVSKDGYDTVTSDAVDIPPPVLDLHIPMTKKQAPVDGGGGGGGTGGGDTGGGGGDTGTGTGTGGGVITPPAGPKPPGTTPKPPVTPPVPCFGLTGLKRATCQADLRYAKAAAKCAKLKGKKKTACVKKAKLERKRAIALAKCDAKTGKKKAACVKAAKKIKK
jgi:hypothetical protein